MKPFLSSFKLFVCVLAAFTTVFYTCSEEPTKPPSNNAADTSSHTFDWEVIPIGEYRTALMDIAALSDTDVWICGKIWTKETGTLDSTGKEIPAYNFGRWNGSRLELFRLYWPICGTGVSLPAQADAVFIRAKDDVWFAAMGNVVANWRAKYIATWCVPRSEWKGMYTQITSIHSNMLFAGIEGCLTQFDGIRFMGLQTNTLKNINDVWTLNDTTLCVASDWSSSVNNETLILRVVGGNVEQWSDTTMRPGGHSVWFDGKGTIYLVGGWLQRWNGKKWDELKNPSWSYLMSVRGTAWNDVFIVGHFGTIMHFNGKTWKLLTEVEPTRSLIFYKIVYIKDNAFIIGNDDQGQFFIYHGRRRR